MLSFGFMKERSVRKVWPVETPRVPPPDSDFYTFSPTVGYCLRRMSTMETENEYACICHDCMTWGLNRMKSLRLEKIEMFAPSDNSSYCPPTEYRKVKGDPKMSFKGLLQEVYDGHVRREKVSKGRLLRLVTYVDPFVDNAYQPEIYYELMRICCNLYFVDLDKAMAKYGNKMPTDFLRRVLMLFVQTWRAFSGGNLLAESSAFQMRRFLTHVLGFPGISSRAFELIADPGYWPRVSPVEILEILAERYLCCTATAILFCNITRSDKMAEFLTRKTRFVELMQNNPEFLQGISERDEMGSVFLQLAINLVPYDEFSRFLIEPNSGDIMEKVILPLIKVSAISTYDEKMAWVLLRNFAITFVGREYIMNNLDVLLGWFLLPIAGPEDLSSIENAVLPDQLKDLPADKQRVSDKMVRECVLDILFSLCQYKNDRERLRGMGVYEVLKLYRNAEETADEDAELIEKAQIVATILNDDKEEVIGFDDLMQGEVFREGQVRWAVNSGPIKVTGVILPL